MNDLDGMANGGAVTDAERQSWPRTGAEAVDRLVARLSAEDTAAIRRMDVDEMRLTLHHTLGLYIRSVDGLWRGTKSSRFAQPSRHLSSSPGAVLVVPRRGRNRRTRSDFRPRA